jgi:hypothetical protein
MSLATSIPVLDTRSPGAEIGNDVAGTKRVVDWAAAHPYGYVWVGDTHTGQSLPIATATDAERLSCQWAWRASAMRRGVKLRTLWGWRGDVLSPPTNRVAPYATDPGVVARSSAPYGQVLAGWQASGWTWGMGDLDPAWWAGLPADRAVYVLEDHTAKRLTITGVLTKLDHAALVQDALDFQAWLDCTGLLIGAKPWERAGAALASPANLADGLLQPTQLKAGQWEGKTAAQLTAIALQIPVLTLTRPWTPPLESYIGYGSAYNAITGAADLRPASEAP